MRFLLDEDVHVKLIDWLKEAGHDAIRVPSGFKNGQVIGLARTESRVLITRDKDFSNRFMYPPEKSAGVVVLSIHPPQLDKLISALTLLLEKLPSEKDFSGKLIILQEQGYRLLS
ncbi:MAG: hypothetical protein COV76_00530 [Candidatus Omnitrophica bacterium CG11_big_fil_rev_8_21_14_0_20_64_10]|nr:MAG: hypothetical protein COV76_00530 [Candidatus Omnitrophica bacterium CG11_big_fil_rev_8_21_14_0_20_64_10]